MIPRVFREMISFISDKKSKIYQLRINSEREVDDRFSCKIILGWLAGQYYSKKQKPLEFSSNASWVEPLRQFILANPNLEKILEVENKLDFSDTVSIEQRIKIQKFVYDRYIPTFPVDNPASKLKGLRNPHLYLPQKTNN